MPFDCNDHDLNDFILNNSKDYLKQLLSVTYLIQDEEITIAFFSLSNDKISADDFRSKRWYNLNIREKMPEGKRYNKYPAVKIGRFGVHKEYQKSGLGTKLLDYIKFMFITNNRTGCQYITVDAYKDSLGFYLKNGFEYFSDSDKDEDTRQMYYKLVHLVNLDN